MVNPTIHNHFINRSVTKHTLISRVCLLGAIFMLGFLTTALFYPAVSSTASADSASTTTSGDSTLSITVPTSVTIDITPDFDSAVFATASASISVSTTNAYGYSLSIGTSGTDASGTATTSLIHKTKSDYTLPSITSATTEANFPTNSWGYTTDNNGTDADLGQITAGYYQPLTTTDSGSILIKKTDTTTSADTTTVTFAAKADSTLPSGDYVNTVTFSATANPKPASEYTIFDISTMQEMTSTVCSNTTTPDAVIGDDVQYDTDESHSGDTTYVPQKTLTDTRDGTEYTIVKLADGNCWMQENLALGTTDSAGLTLTSDTSDVSSDWTLPAYTSIGTTWSASTNDAYVVQGSTTASSSWTEGMGNWYTWGAATAGTSSSATTAQAEASDSICPKGWQLPVTDTNYNYDEFGSPLDKSFGGLFTAYNLTSSSSSTSTTIRAVPLSFACAGAYYNGGGNIGNVSANGYYWSSIAYNSLNAYYLAFYSSKVNPQGYDGYRGYGLSVRCVSQ